MGNDRLSKRALYCQTKIYKNMVSRMSAKHERGARLQRLRASTATASLDLRTAYLFGTQSKKDNTKVPVRKDNIYNLFALGRPA